MTRYILMRIYKPSEVAKVWGSSRESLPAGYMPVFDDYDQAKAWNPEGQYEITIMEG